MPYLRLYSQEIAIEKKRIIARKLIEATLRAFQLRPEESNRITIQFVPLEESPDTAITPDAEATLEVLAHDLTKEKKNAFMRQAADVLAMLKPGLTGSKIARFFGFKADLPPHVAIQFNPLSPAISDPLLLEADRWAA